MGGPSDLKRGSRFLSCGRTRPARTRLARRPARVVLSALAGVLAAGTAGSRTPATLETPVELVSEAGQVSTFGVELTAGRILRIVAEQGGTDVLLTVDGPEGRELVAVDSPDDRLGAEKVVWPVAVTGTHLVRVLTKTRGRCRIAVEELTALAAGQRPRIDAERAETVAAQLYLRGTAESWRQAVTEYRKALAYWQTVGNPQQARTLHRLGALYRKLDEAPQALEHLGRALWMWRAAGDSRSEAGTLNLIGLTHRDRDGYAPALAAFQQALALREAAGDRCGRAEILNNAALVHQSRGRPRAALDAYEEAVELCDTGAAPELEATLLMNAGGAYAQLGELHRALASHERALPLLRALPQRRKEAVALNNIGMYRRRLGEYRRAFESYLSALEIAREIGDRRLQGAILNALGNVYLHLGDPERALSFLRQSLPLRRAVGDRRGEAITLNNLGTVHGRLGQSHAALGVYRQALAIYRAIGNRHGEASGLDRIGSVQVELGEPKTAVENFERALALRREVGDPYGEAETLGRLGEAHLTLGEAATARDLLRRSLELRRRLKDRAGEARSLTALARAERALGALGQSHAHLAAAIAAIEALRVRVDDLDLRASFLAARRDAYASALDLSMELHRRDPSTGHDLRALEISERARARSLLELLHEAGAQIDRGADPELVARRELLRQRASVDAARHRRLLGRDGDPRRAAAIEGQLEKNLIELRQVEAEIRRQSPGYAALTRSRPLRPAELQRLLEPGTLLLEYALGEERSFLWAVTAETVASFELASRRRIEDAARRLHRLWSTADAGGRGAELDAAADLSRRILGPVAARLGDGTRLVIVADGALHYVPFAALPDPGTRGAYRPLLVRHEVVVLPSASVLAVLREPGARPAARGTVAVMADPIFSRDDPRVTGSPPASQEPAAAGRWRSSPEPAGGELRRLPSSRLEAHAIAASAPGAAVTFLDSRARREFAVAGHLSTHRIVHFATHGILDGHPPRLSGLVLSRFDENGRTLDGFLSLQDVYDLRLAADLVVLSGCRTALGKEVRGEGLVGLARGFMYAGAARVVASLWRVQDRATAELMGRYYRSLLRSGEPPAAALRTAQLGMWRETEWKDPYFWAGFVHLGDWR